MAKDKRPADAEPLPVVNPNADPKPAGEDPAFEPVPLLSEESDASGNPATGGEEEVGAAGPTYDDNPYGASLGSGQSGAWEDTKAVGAVAKDVGKSAVRGAEKGVEESIHFFGSVLQSMDDSDTYSTLEGAPAGGLKPDAISQGIYDATTKLDIPKPGPPTTIAGSITEGVSQFIVGMIGAGKVLKGAELMQGGGKLLFSARAAVEGGLAQGVAFNPNEERLSNLIENYPSLANPVNEYLAAKPEDSEAEGRLKNFLEGTVGGIAVESIIGAIRGIRSIRAARASGGEEAANAETIKVSQELQDVLKLQKQMQAEKAAPPVEGTMQSQGQVSNIRPLPGHKLTPNVEPVTDNIKDYIRDRITNGAELDPGYSRDFNISKQATTDGAKQVINLMSDALAPEIDSLKGGVQTFETIKKLADVAGERPEVLMARMSARAANAKRMASDVVATHELMQSMARSISEEARAVDNGLKDPEMLNKMMDSLGGIVADLKAVQTGAARTTAAGRIVKGDPYSMEQIKALVASGGDLEAVAKMVNPPGVVRRSINAYTEYWVNALLSGPKTHIVNNTTNILQTFAMPTEKILGGQVREGLSQFMGIAKGIQDSIAMSAKAFKMEESILDPRNGKVDAPRFAISAKAAGLNPNSFFGAVVDWTGKAIRLPTRFLMAEDEFFKQLNYRAVVYAKSTREGVEKGLDGPQLATYIEDRFQNAFNGDGQGMDEAALQEARISTFTEDLNPNGLAQKVLDATHEHPGIRLILPFIKTPTNLVKQLGHRTPLVNLAMKSYREELKAGGSRAAAARGKWATGGALWSAGLLLASQGNLTGRGPSDPDKRAAMMQTGWRPYSIKSGDTYYDYSRLDPFGMALGLAADFTEARGYLPDADAEDIALAMGAAMARNLTSKTYLRGMTEALDAMSQPDQKFKKWFQSRVGSHVPSGLQQVAGLVGEGDDTMREVRSAMDALRARTPGLSDNLPPRRNLLGEPIHFPPGLGPDSVSPFTASKDLSDPVKTELARLSYGFKPPAEKINGGRIDLTKYKNEKGQDAFDRLGELRTIERKGRYTLKERLAAEIESDRYKKLPDGNDEYSSKKLDRVRAILGEYQEVTMKRLRKEYPQLDADIKTDEHNVKSVKRSGPDAIKALLGQQ